MITVLSNKYENGKSEEFLVHYGEGATLFTEYETSIQIMSDVWVSGESATYWDDAKGSPVKMNFKVYDGMLTDRYNAAASATVDATPGVYAKYFRWLRDLEFQRTMSYRQKLIDKAWGIFNKDDQVRIAKGNSRKGEVGKVVALTSAVYNAAHRYSGWRNSPEPEQKLLVAFSDEKVDTYFPKYKKTYPVYTNSAWVWARNVVKVLAVKPTLTETDQAEALEHANLVAAQTFMKLKLSIPEGI